MKTRQEITTMMVVVEMLHSDCPIRQAAIFGGLQMLKWVLDEVPHECLFNPPTPKGETIQ